MPAVSKKQQRFFGMVRAAQKGEMKNPSSEVSDVASEISMKDAKKFAKTKHKGLPEKKEVKEENKGRHPRDQKELDRARAFIKKNPNFGKKDVKEESVPRNSMGKPIRIKDKIKAAKGQIPHRVKEGYKGTADLSKSHPEAKKKVEDKIEKHFGTKKVPGGKMGVKESIKRDEYGDPIGGPKISKKQVKKNLASNAKDEKIVHSEDYEERAKSRQKFVDFYKKAKEAKAKKQADSTRSDSRRHGIKFSDAKGSGRIKAGKKIYD